MRSRPILALAFAAGVVGCGAAPRAVAPPVVEGPSRILYEARARSADPWVIEVRATFEGGVGRGALAFPPAVSGVVVEEGGATRSPEPYGRAWKLDCKATCTVNYAVDLSAAAELTEDAPTVALRSEGDMLALGSTWLMAPESAAPETPATIRVDVRDPAGGEPIRFAAPFARDAGGDYHVVARDVRALGYTAWGRFAGFAVKATAGDVDVVVLRGPREASDAALTRWIQTTALALDSVFGRFPIERTLIAVVPLEGSGDVEFGRTVPAGGASIVLYVGEHARETALYADWVLAHELVHLGVPSMPRDGTWIDEGLATYYGPVLRARAGLLSGDATWAEMARILPMGVATAEEPALAAASEHDRVYFGGSLFALTADVEIRRRTGGSRSLDDGLRRALAEGARATEVWSSQRFVDALDRGVGARVVRPLFERVQVASKPCGPALAAGLLRDLSACAPDDVVSLLALLDALGVRPGTGSQVELSESAPLAGVRRGIVAKDPFVLASIARLAHSSSPGSGSARANAGVEDP
ncbi:MAG: hypothetical protein U0441_38425 [Polyangiaceae bacterium]